MMIDKKAIMFPYPSVRKIQDEFISSVQKSLENKQDLIVHAPTGLGKTVAALSPALSFAIKNDLSVIFLTSRHTQHHLAIETLKDIKREHDVDITVTDIIGKKWMCSQIGSGNLYSAEFAEFCKKLREEGSCEFYSNCRSGGKLSVRAKQTLSTLNSGIYHIEQILDICRKEKLCPYEIVLMLASKSHVVIADYYYVFHPKISEMFLGRADKELGKSIVIVDEAHNLPVRIRDLASTRISSNILRRAVQEAKKFGYNETIERLVIIQDILNEYAKDLRVDEERLIKRDDFIGKVSTHIDFQQLIDDFDFIANSVREAQRQSYIGSVSAFLESWLGPEEGFARILKLSESGGRQMVMLSNSCLDPSVISRPVIRELYSTIMMSGTLTPTEMYRDLLGFGDTAMETYTSPFPDINRLNLVVPRTTTRFTERNPRQYENIARVCAEITDAVPGNTLLFFPSYHIRDRVYEFFAPMSNKACFLEKPMLSKEEKGRLLEKFKANSDSGAVLLCVASGSFSEGIDLPGDLLKCVVIAGLPLQHPDLETRELIRYYDSKFSRGWDYGYIFPAFNRALQSAGRCIRSETDRGVVVFLDERYLWPRYRRLFPQDWDIKVSKDYADDIREFFNC